MRRIRDIWTRSGQRKAATHQREAVEFLPAALEIVESPPSPIGRAITWTILAAACAALSWAYLASVDIVAIATGKVIPSGRIKVLQPLEIGAVRDIHVRDGQQVKEGDVLVELDPTTAESDRDRVRKDLLAVEIDIARLRAALADSADPLAHFVPPKEAPVGLLATQREYLLKQTGELQTKIASFERQKAQKDSEKKTVNATIDKLKAVIPAIQQRVDLRVALQDYGTKLAYYETLQQLIEHQQDVNVQNNRLNELDAAIAALDETKNQTRAEYSRILYAQLAEAEQKAQGLRQDLVKAEKRLSFMKLTAPVDGIVQQLSIHTVGGVVTPAQILMSIVPLDGPLEVEVNVQNRDIGFVRTGQPVEIKVETFNFTRYGLLHGRVAGISQDAVVRERPADATRSTSSQGQAVANEAKVQDLVYVARIALEQTALEIDGRTVKLIPGMSVTAEIKTGARSVLSYVLSPIVKLSQESMRER